MAKLPNNAGGATHFRTQLSICLVAAAFVALAAMACSNSSSPDGPDNNGNTAACTTAPALSQFPVPVETLRWIGPLGAMTGGGHLFPASHLGLHTQANPGGPASVPLSAPGTLVVTQVSRVTFNTPGAPTLVDYAIYFSPCADVKMHFGHVPTLSAALVAQVGSFEGAECPAPYMVGQTTVQPCTKAVEIEMQAGEPLGSLGAAGVMDWGASDRRITLAFVNPARMGGNDSEFGPNNTACPVDYLATGVRNSVHDLFGEAGVFRSVEPVCGTVMQDIAGTAQGRWFINDELNERLHLALVRDYLAPATAAFSVGTSIPSVPSNLYRFVPSGGGRVNVDFPGVQADGLIYCFETTTHPSSGVRVILVQLVTNVRLKIEGRAGAECGDAAGWGFTAGAVEFSR